MMISEATACLQKIAKNRNGPIILVREAYRKEEIYSGQFIDNLPDIIIRLDNAYEGGVGLDEIISNSSQAGYKKWSGYHLPEGVFIASGANIKKGECVKGVSIADIAPTILYVLNQSIPKNMDGQVLLQVFHNATQDVRYEDVDNIVATNNQKVLQEDEERKRALRALGYME